MSFDLFVCEGCGGVFRVMCEECPMGSKGATVQQIKDAILAAPTQGDISNARKHYGRHIATLRREGGVARTMAKQIENLVPWCRDGLAKG